MWTITLILIGLIVWLYNHWVNSQFKYWKKLGIPYSRLSPFWQLYYHVFTKKGVLEHIVADYKAHTGAKMVGQYQMFTPAIMIRDVDLIYNMCIKDFLYFEDRNLPTDIPDLLTEGVGNLTGSRWRVLRNKLTPTFTSGKLKMMFASINENSNEIVSFLNNKINEDVDARDIMYKYVINVTGNVLFGLKVDAFNNEDNEFLKASKRSFEPSTMLLLKFVILMAMPKVRNVIKFRMVDKQTDTFFKTIVKDLIAHREKTGEVRNDFLKLMLDLRKKEQGDKHCNLKHRNNTTENSLKEQADEPEDNELLEQLKNMDNEHEKNTSTELFTDDCIAAQSFSFISAGSETTAAALSFILFDLAANPEFQNKVQNEVENQISKEGLTYQSVNRMTYLDNFIEESLRIHSIAAGLSRFCTKDYHVPDTNVVIEKGTCIFLPVPQLMNDAQYFPEPEKFNPDRFEDIRAYHPGLMLTFGIGPRMCIAKRLALLKMKIVVAVLVQNFTIKLSPKTKLPLRLDSSSVFQHVVGGIWVQFEARKKSV